MSQVIHFYSTKDDYGCFSNFSPHSVELKGKVWPTSEHYFQAQKFAGHPDEEEVRQAASPMIAARMGRSQGTVPPGLGVRQVGRDARGGAGQVHSGPGADGRPARDG